jgi:hypothetical protein
MKSNAGNPDLSTLKNIRSLELFSDDQLSNLAQSLTINVAKPGDHIIAAGDTGFCRVTPSAGPWMALPKK